MASIPAYEPQHRPAFGQSIRCSRPCRVRIILDVESPTEILLPDKLLPPMPAHRTCGDATCGSMCWLGREGDVDSRRAMELRGIGNHLITAKKDFGQTVLIAWRGRRC